MAGLYIDDYRPWPDWVDEGNREIATRFRAQIGTYRGHADGDPGHDMTGDKAADFFLFDNSKDEHDRVLAWFKSNAERLGATYIITWRRIWSVARASEGVRVYTLKDPHTGHIHVSYGNTPPQEEDMNLTAENLQDIAKAVWAYKGIDPPKGAEADPGQKWSTGGALEFTMDRTVAIDKKLPDKTP